MEAGVSDHKRMRATATIAQRLAIAAFMVVTLISQASGQLLYTPVPNRPNRGNVDYPAVPLEQAADVIVVLVPDRTFYLVFPTPHERVVHGSITHLLKGPLPHTIVHTPNTFVTSLEKGVPTKLFLKKFADRDAYYIIGNFAVRSGE